MPYQGSGYVPPFEYYGHQQDGQAHLYSQNGQPRPMARHHPQQMQQQQPHQTYRQTATQSHTQYATPQHYGQGQASSFYQTPQYQQPYLSPPLQQTGLPQQRPYSPDPLQFYQAPPQPRQAAHQGYQQQREQISQVSHQLSQTPQALRQQPNPQSQWNNLPQSLYEAPVQSAAGPAIRNPHPVQPQQRPHQPQRPPSQGFQAQRPASQASQYRHQVPLDARRPSPVQIPGQGPPQHRPNQGTQSVIGRPSPVQQPMPAPQKPVHQVHRPSSVNKPPQASSSRAPASIDASSITGKAARVSVPAQRAIVQDEIKYEDPMEPPPKRRRSNEGLPISASEMTPRPQHRATNHQIKKVPPRPQHKSQLARPNQQQPSSPSLAELKSSQVPATPTPASNVEYNTVLLSLSDEYIRAAYNLSTSLAGADVAEDVLAQYQGLLATGMNCLDTVLRNCPVSDKRKEARIRLRLASLLSEETDDERDAEETLSKGIPICERARLSDLKYAMHHLLSRISFKGGKPKAAMTAVDKLVVETEKLQLTHWSYAFRFLRVSFGLLSPGNQRETSAMIKNLALMIETAAHNQHHAVEIVASTLLAMVHLRSRHSDSVDMALRALATARTQQLTPAMTAMPQIRALLDCIDLACTLARFNHQLSQNKMQEMQTNMDAITRDLHWSTDGALHVPLGVQKDVDMDAETGGIMKQTAEGEVTLYFSWLTKTQVYSFGFLLSGLSVMNKSVSNDQKAETFLAEGIKLSKLNLELAPQSLSAACGKYHQQLQLRIMLRLYVVFACCGRSDWEVATTKGLEALRRDIAELDAKPEQHLQTLMAYLEALCKHGLGDLQGALRIYRSDDLAFLPEQDAKSGAANVDPIKVLAALNSVLIMRGFGQDNDADQLLHSIEPFCVVVANSSGNEHGSKAMEAAFHILQATSSSQSAKDSAIMTTKKSLQLAVLAAKAVGNSQLLCIVMNVMTDAFFHNIVGDQAEKSAKAGRTLALKSQDKLWTAVADGMYAETLERCGKKTEAQQMGQEAQETLQRLPRALKAVLPTDESDA